MSDEACLFLMFVPLIILLATWSSPAPTEDENSCAFCGLPFSVCDGDCWESETGERTGSYSGDVRDYMD